MTRTLTRIGIAICALLGLMQPARAACDIVGVQSVMPSVMNIGTFSATALPPPGIIALTVTLNVVGNGGGCKGEYGLVRSAPPAQMTRIPAAPVALPYGVTSLGSQILSFGVIASARRRLPNFNVQNGTTTISVALIFTITPTAPLGTPSTGSYADQLSLQIYNREGPARLLVGQLPVTVAATVIDSCYLSTPNTLAMNFNADVATGLPGGAVQTVTFTVNCTGPSRVQLTGSALTSGVPLSSGAFDNFIDYRAVTTFGAASATLITNGSTPVSVTSPSTSSLSGTNLPVGVNVNLIAKKPLVGNTAYNGVLRITVDPTL